MRIIGGSARGRRLRAPAGLDTRPTADRVRQSLFDILGQRCDGLRVLDLYAGTGALGLEALSRGAQSCVFVERARPALEALEANIAALGFEARATVRRRDALELGDLPTPVDLVFADPPYQTGVGPVLAALGALPADRLGEGARVVVEHGRHEVTPETIGALERVDERRFGETMVTFYQRRRETSG